MQETPAGGIYLSMEPVLGRRHARASLSCRDAELAVLRELDGALSPHERRNLRLHLSVCHDCGAFACGQMALRVAIQTLASVPLPPGLRRFSSERKFWGAPASP